MKSVFPTNEGRRKPRPVHGTSRTTRSKIHRKKRTDQCKTYRVVRVRMKTEVPSRPGNGNFGRCTGGRSGGRRCLKREGEDWNGRRNETCTNAFRPVHGTDAPSRPRDGVSVPWTGRCMCPVHGTKPVCSRLIPPTGSRVGEQAEQRSRTLGSRAEVRTSGS